MFSANSMNCLAEALGLALPGNGTLLATHALRRDLFARAGRTIADLAFSHYRDGRDGTLPREIACFRAFENAMALDIAMGGSTNTVLHALAIAREGNIGSARRRRPPVAQDPHPVQGRAGLRDYHVEDVHRAGGIMVILGELDRRLIHRDRRTCPENDRRGDRRIGTSAPDRLRRQNGFSGQHPAAVAPASRSASPASTCRSISTVRRAASARPAMPTAATADWPCCMAIWRPRGPY